MPQLKPVIIKDRVKKVKTITTETQDREEYQGERELHSYSCLCGQHALLLDCRIDQLPLRAKDRARVIDSSKHANRLSVAEGEKCFIKHDGGYERQFRKVCKKCGLWLCYAHQEGRSTVVFVNEGVLKLMQGNESSSDVFKQVTDKQKKIMLKKQIRDSGRNSSVTVSTIEDDEEELEQKEISDSYAKNARVVERFMSKKGLLARREEEEAAIRAKKKKGTLIDF